MHGIHFSLTSTEPQIFKARFVDWDEVLSVDFTRTPEMLEKRQKALVSWETRGGGGWMEHTHIHTDGRTHTHCRRAILVPFQRRRQPRWTSLLCFSLDSLQCPTEKL